MDVQERAQTGVGHVVENRVAHGPRIVDEYVVPAPSLERGIDDRLAAFRRRDTIHVGYCFASLIIDLAGGCVGRVFRLPPPSPTHRDR